MLRFRDVVWTTLVPCVLLGCAGTKTDLNPIASEVGRIQREAEATSKDDVSANLLATSVSLSSRAEEAGQNDEASRAYLEARASGRASLAAAAAHNWMAEADECRRTAAEMRREWEDAVVMLEQSEKIAGRQARGITRTAPAARAEEPLPDRIPVPTEVVPEANLVREASEDWRLAAARYRVPTVDLDGAVVSSLTAAETPKVEPLIRDYHLRMAAWSILELGYQVEGEASRHACTEAMNGALEMAGYRDQALWAMVDLERGMKDSARSELEEERRRLADRENQLFESLQQFEGQFASIRKEARGTIMSLSDILFDFGKADLRREAELNLAKVAVILIQYPEMQILVEGHTDNIGSEKYNLELSEKRAQAVSEFLVSQGVDTSRLETKGYGFSQPLASNADEAGRQQNRRVDLVIREE